MDEPAPPAVRLDRVTKRFDDYLALADVSVAIGSDCVTAIIGESGSGKSTLLQMINGLLRPDSGAVSVLDKTVDYDALAQLRQRIGYAVQGIGLFPHLTVGDNIGLLAKLRGWHRDRIATRRAHLLAMMGLDDTMLARYPHELSGGQQQRIGLCRAMMLDPPVLLLDEPFSGVDPMTRTRIHDEFIALQRHEPRTVVLVTHDLREARRLSQKLVILDRGRIVRDGDTEWVLQHPVGEKMRALFEAQL